MPLPLPAPSRRSDVCRKQVLESKLEAEKDGVVVPTTLQQYCHSSKLTAPSFESQSSVDFDYYDSYSVDADDSDSDIVTLTSWPIVAAVT